MRKLIAGLLVVVILLAPLPTRAESPLAVKVRLPAPPALAHSNTQPQLQTQPHGQPPREPQGLHSSQHQGALPGFASSEPSPGRAPRLASAAPSPAFAQIPPLASLLGRFRDALLTPLTGGTAGRTGLILGAYAPLALGVGRRSGFLLAPWRWPPLGVLLRGSLPLLLMPALGEELFFRVALLPHPAGGPNLAGFWAWGALNVGLFVAYHPLAARLWDRRRPAVFDDPRFLLQCSLLGSACVLAYGASGSLWAPVLIHWLAVAAWLGPLEGHRCLPGIKKPHESAAS